MLLPGQHVNIDTLHSALAERYGISVEMLLSRSRESQHTTPRLIGMYLAIHAGYSTPRAALAFNRSDHTTALYAKRRVTQSMRESAAFARVVQEIAQQCGLDPVECAA